MAGKISGFLQGMRGLLAGYSKYPIYDITYDTPEDICLRATVATSHTGPSLTDRIIELLEHDIKSPVSNLKIDETKKFSYDEAVISNSGRGDMDCAQEGYYSPGRR